MPVSLPPHQWDLLLRCPLFQACPEALVRDVLARSGCSVEEFSSGAEIYRPDRFRRCLGLLLSGRVLVTKGSLTVSTLEPGDLFGAAALYNDAPDYATTLTARAPCRVLLPPKGSAAASCWTRSCWTAFWGRRPCCAGTI